MYLNLVTVQVMKFKHTQSNLPSFDIAYFDVLVNLFFFILNPLCPPVPQNLAWKRALKNVGRAEGSQIHNTSTD